MDGIKDKVAIVTGGATLIGAAVVRAFHKAGARVVSFITGTDLAVDGGYSATGPEWPSLRFPN